MSKEPPKAGFYKFDLLAWGIGIAALGIALFVMHRVVHSAAVAFRLASREQFGRAIVDARTSDALVLLDQLFDGPPLLSVLPGARAGAPAVPRDVVEGLVYDLGSLSAEQIFGVDQRLVQAAEQSPNKSPAQARARQLIAALREQLQPILEKQRALDGLRAEQKQLLQAHQEALRQLNLLIKDTAALLSLPPGPAVDGAESVRFYGSGMLKGLPHVESLPDGITSLPELRERVRVVGGALAGDSGGQFEKLLSGRIGSLQESAVSIEASLRQTGGKLPALSQVIEADRDQIESELQLYSSEFRAKLAELVQ